MLQRLSRVIDRMLQLQVLRKPLEYNRKRIDPVKGTEEKRFPTLTVLSIAPLLASTIREVFDNGSVTGLFDGSA